MIVFFSKIPLSFNCVCGSNHLSFEVSDINFFENEMHHSLLVSSFEDFLNFCSFSSD
jgi:hypothetical protein